MSNAPQSPLLWVTRPGQQGIATAGRLRTLNYRTLASPLLTVEALSLPDIDFGPIGALVLTSSHALPALVRWAITAPQLRTLPVLTTGKATAQAALEAGFAHVVPVQGSALDVVAQARTHLPKTFDPARQVILYPCAQETAHDLTALFAAQDLRCLSAPVYAMVASPIMPTDVTEVWQDGEVSGVLLYSPRTAQTFAHVASGAMQTKPALFCLSQAIADALPSQWRERAHWCERPDEALLLAHIQSILPPRTG